MKTLLSAKNPQSTKSRDAKAISPHVLPAEDVQPVSAAAGEAGIVSPINIRKTTFSTKLVFISLHQFKLLLPELIKKTFSHFYQYYSYIPVFLFTFIFASITCKSNLAIVIFSKRGHQNNCECKGWTC